MIGMKKDEALADILAQYMPRGIVSGRYQYADGRDLFHPNLDTLREYLKSDPIESALEKNVVSLNEDVKKLQIGLKSREEDPYDNKAREYLSDLQEKLERSETQLSWFKENKEYLISNLEYVVTQHLSIEYDEPAFPEPPLRAAGAAFTMVEPWQHQYRADNAIHFRAILKEKHAWGALKETLEHYGTRVTTIPSSELGAEANRSVWARDPSITLQSSEGLTAFMSEDHLMPKVEETRYYKRHLEERGVEVKQLMAEIEGGNILFDTTNNVMLFSTNSRTDDYHKERLAEIQTKFQAIEKAVMEQVGHELNLDDTLLRKAENLSYNNNTSVYEIIKVQDEARDFFVKQIPEGVMLSINGNSVEARDYAMNMALDFGQNYGAIVNDNRRLNRYADILQEESGVPVIPVPGTSKEFYHLDTFAATLSDSTDGTLLIHPEKTTPEAMKRLRGFYGDNLIELNDEDLAGLGPNLVQTGNVLITNNFSPETARKIEEKGFQLVTRDSVGFQYDFIYDNDENNYVGSGIRCLTDETNGVRLESRDVEDGEGTEFHASLPAHLKVSADRSGPKK